MRGGYWSGRFQSMNTNLFSCRNVRRTVFAIVLCAALSAPNATAEPSTEALWQETLNRIRDDFPRVNHISTDELATMLARQTPFVLLDTRRPEEFSVSHIKGAVLSEDVGDALDALENRSRDDLVIVYCSVGYRSSKIAAKLARRGYSNVFNLEGSLFKWANEDRPLFRDVRPAAKVHPYDDEWGQLLEPKFWP